MRNESGGFGDQMQDLRGGAARGGFWPHARGCGAPTSPLTSAGRGGPRRGGAALGVVSLSVVLQSLGRVCLFATPWTVARQAPVSMGFPRQEYRLQGTNSEEPLDCSGEKSRRQSTCQSQTWRRPGPEGVDLGVSLLHV